MAAIDCNLLFLSCNDPNGNQNRKAKRHVQLAVNRQTSQRDMQDMVPTYQIRFRASRHCSCGRIRCICRKIATLRTANELYVPILCPFPTSPDYTRASQLSQCISRLGLQDTTVAHMPSRLGNGNSMLDRATDAFVQLHISSHRSSAGTIVPSKTALQSYHDSLALFRFYLANGDYRLDDALGATGLLGMFNVLSRDPVRSTIECLAHWRGASALVLREYPASVTSEFARVSVLVAGCLTFIIPCYQGKPSPFERQKLWWDMEVTAGSDEIARLSRATHRLHIVIPRVICLVREFRNGENKDSRKAIKQLAEEWAMKLEDREAEHWVLARTTTCNTSGSTETTKLVPHSFRMASQKENSVAILYWQARVMILKLLDVIAPETRPDRAAEEERMATNILKSWQHAISGGLCGTPSVTYGLCAAWLVFRERAEFRGVPIDRLADLMLDIMTRCWSGALIGGTREELDKAVNIIVGGKLEGFTYRVVSGLI